MAWPGLTPAPKPETKPATDEVLTPREVARELRVSLTWVYTALRTGELPHLALGQRMRRVLRSQLEEYKAGRIEGRR